MFYHENDYHVSVLDLKPIMVGCARIWTDETKQKWVTDIKLEPTDYEQYKQIEDKEAYVEELAQKVINLNNDNLQNLCEVVDTGLYVQENPINEVAVQV